MSIDEARETSEATVADHAHIEEGTTIGRGTYVWHRAQVRTGASLSKKCRQETNRLNGFACKWDGET